MNPTSTAAARPAYASARKRGRTLASDVFQQLRSDILECRLTPGARLRFKDGQPPGLRQNQRLSARILLDTRRNVLMVDRGPFLEQGGGSAYVMDGDSAVKRPIRTGASSLGAVEILDGVKEGDRIVVSGSDLFGDAQRVTIH